MYLIGNTLFDGLSEPLRQTIANGGEQVDLPLRGTLFNSEALPRHLYFLTSGLASIVVNMSEGGSCETEIMGKEALAGASSLLGPQCATAECFMQMRGSGLRVPRTLMETLFADSAEFRNRVLQYLQRELNASYRSTACGRLHEAEARLARWLLTAADRLGSDNVELTQEAISQMLGMRRTTVALVAGTLRKAGMIRYHRGHVEIVDRAALTSAACECYGVIRQLSGESYKA